MPVTQKDATTIGRFIVSDPQIAQGRPTFRGTRILVSHVLEQVASGTAWETVIATHHGQLHAEAIAEAIQLSTRLAPRNADAWLMRAQTARTQQEALRFLCRVFLLNVNHAVAKRRMYRLLQPVLTQDAYLAYIDQEAAYYRVRTGTGQPLIVPKDRALPTAPSQIKAVQIRILYRWLALTVLGLLPAGLGTLILAPITLLRAFWVQIKTPLHAADQARLTVLVLVLIILWFISLIISSLFLLHL